MTSPARARLALVPVWLIALWVLAGATFKLFWGTPALLPAVVRDVGLELGLTYNLAIGIELAIVAVALARPRWGWVLQAALLVVFDVVLTTQIAAGDENCGCFGNKFSMPPWLMMVIDTALLVFLLAVKPWRHLPAGAPPLVPVGAAAVALALPWLFDRQVQTGELVANGKPTAGQWIELDVESWVGQTIFDTPLAQPPLSGYVDVNALPLEGLWVFWRATCEHCRDHLAHLADTEHGERLVTLVQIEEPNDTLGNRVVNRMPDGNFVQHAVLPPALTYLMQTPAELVLEAGTITAAKEAVTVESGL
ncbi:MAG TPA: MauE/DoxX family redox-associated membrane protein [Planctomycetota bacterium]